ncbi:MAG: 3-hydroxyacyl-CoA dehydrogenase family protein [Pirellulaceae bacterium]
MNQQDTITRLPKTILVGTGVVGRAILQSHAVAGVSVCVTDQDHLSLDEAVQEVVVIRPDAIVSEVCVDDGNLRLAVLEFEQDAGCDHPTVVIESIAERLELKQAFFRDAERVFGKDAILCSNTSTLQIESIAVGLQRPERLCGMHFFMPVERRPAVEVVRSDFSSDHVVKTCEAHVRRLNKWPLVVADRPGFIVNRLLSPYLNQALLLLTRGVSAERIETAALAYGMPMSPLELIDFIGTRTMLNAGRSFWQAFPSRMEPSLVVPRLLKKKRFGRATGEGMYDYQNGQRSEALSEVARGIVAEYSTEPIKVSDGDLVYLLAVPMWIEAALAYQDGITDNLTDFDLAVEGGLGYRASPSWWATIDSLGQHSIAAAIERWSGEFKSMQAPSKLLDSLKTRSASQATQEWNED